MPPSTNPGTQIDAAGAKAIALQHAGLTESQVTFIKAKLDWDDGRQVYDVEFYYDNTEYDYEIDAATGQIREWDRDIENFMPPSTNPGTQIDAAGAKAIALAHAGLTESQVTFIKAKLDWDDGRQVYDVEFYYDNTEYDYEIDAATGQIREWDRDIENFTPPSTNPGTQIDAAGAKAIALQHAGLTESQVTFIKAKLDKDDGRQVYDVEFYYGIYEYEYEIDAATGQIRDWDRDIDD